MLNDIFPSVFDNSFRPCAPEAGDPVLLFGKNSAAVREEGGVLSVPTFPEVPATQDDYLFRIDGKPYFGRFSEDIPLGFSFMPLRSVFGKKPDSLPFAITTGYHIASWRRYHRYCGICGTALVPSKTERALSCPSCGHTIYPDIHPAVNIAVRNGDSLLLIVNNSGPFPRYSLVAGFIEIGETAEQTVSREVCEEVGLKVKNIRYYGSQPWGIAGNLQIGYVCDVDGSDEIRVDGTEVHEAHWVPRALIPQRDTSSITGEMINAFRDGEI